MSSPRPAEPEPLPRGGLLRLWDRLLRWLGRSSAPEIGPPSRARIGGGLVSRGLVIKRCMVCGDPLRSRPTVNCRNQSPHRVHESCRSLTKDRCPVCGWPLDQAG